MEDINIYEHFEDFRKNIIGEGQGFTHENLERKIKYADWTASGRLYGPIEEIILSKIGPWVANTHTEASLCGATMTRAYHKARQIIKTHVNASEDDALITCGTGMTGALSKLQRILGLRVPEKLEPYLQIPDNSRPVVFISHMEHHSNHTSWLETICDVHIIPPDEEGLIDLNSLVKLLEKFPQRQKIVSVTACSNVTGIQTPFRKIAEITHSHQGWCFVDFACSAPYVNIDMHPNETEYLDAITFSPHKFLGGPGSCGILVFNNALYKNFIPDEPGGGTVVFTDSWGNHKFKKNIEEREDGGTPGFLQAIKASLAIKLKEAMDLEKIAMREKEITQIVFKQLRKIKGCHILAGQHTNRLPVFSFYLESLHYELVVQLLSDRFGIQARGGCSCAGTYGHYLLNIDKAQSQRIMLDSEIGCLINKPGWVRLSFHPVMTDDEINHICHTVKRIAENGEEWSKDYISTHFGFRHKVGGPRIEVEQWFQLDIHPVIPL